MCKSHCCAFCVCFVRAGAFWGVFPSALYRTVEGLRTQNLSADILASSIFSLFNNGKKTGAAGCHATQCVCVVTVQCVCES